MICFCNGKNDVCLDDSMCNSCSHYNGYGCTYIKTNIDLIRTLSVESLASFLARINGDIAGGTSVMWERWLNESVECDEFTRKDTILYQILDSIDRND